MFRSKSEVTGLDHLLTLSEKRRNASYLLLTESLLVCILLLLWHWKLSFLQIAPFIAAMIFLMDSLTNKMTQTTGIGFLVVSVIKSILLIGFLIYYSTHLDKAMAQDGIVDISEKESEKKLILWLAIPSVLCEMIFILYAITVIEISLEITDSVGEPLSLHASNRSSSGSESQPLKSVDDDEEDNKRMSL